MRWVELGRIGSPFGVRGWVHVNSFTEQPENLLEYRTWNLRRANGERVAIRVLEGRRQGKQLVAKLEGIDDREAAAELRGLFIDVPRDQMPPPGEGKFYRADLIGLTVRNREGELLGTVQYFIDAPANPVMVVKGEREHWVPVTPQHLDKVDLDSGLIAVDWPAELD